MVAEPMRRSRRFLSARYAQPRRPEVDGPGGLSLHTSAFSQFPSR